MCAGLRAGPDQRTQPTRGARHRPPAPIQLSRLPPPTHAARARPSCRHGPSTHLACTQDLHRKPGFKSAYDSRAPWTQATRTLCIWHGMGVLAVDAMAIECLRVYRRGERFGLVHRLVALSGLLLRWSSGDLGSWCVKHWWITETLLTMRTLRVSRS
jgi:hypothetical protein